MGGILLPKVQNAVFTGPGGAHKFHHVTLQAAPHVADVTASADTSKTLMNGIPIYNVGAVGSIYSSGFAKSQLSTITLGTMVIKPYEWTVGKRWDLTDTTGSGNSEKNWDWGWPIIHGRLLAWVKSTGPLYVTDTDTLSAVFDVFGTVAGTVKYRHQVLQAPIREGGPIAIALQFQATGAITHTGGTAPSCATADGDPPKGSLSLAMDTGETVAHTVLNHNYSVRATANVGGPLILNCNFRFDQTSA